LIDDLKEFQSIGKGFWIAPPKKINCRNKEFLLMMEKGGDKTEQDKRLNKCVLKTLRIRNIKSSNKQTSHHIKRKPVKLVWKSLKYQKNFYDYILKTFINIVKFYTNILTFCFI